MTKQREEQKNLPRNSYYRTPAPNNYTHKRDYTVQLSNPHNSETQRNENLNPLLDARNISFPSEEIHNFRKFVYLR